MPESTSSSSVPAPVSSPHTEEESRKPTSPKPNSTVFKNQFMLLHIPSMDWPTFVKVSPLPSTWICPLTFISELTVPPHSLNSSFPTLSSAMLQLLFAPTAAVRSLLVQSVCQLVPTTLSPSLSRIAAEDAWLVPLSMEWWSIQQMMAAFAEVDSLLTMGCAMTQRRGQCFTLLHLLIRME